MSLWYCHNWEEHSGPSSEFMYYRCSVCGVYSAVPKNAGGPISVPTSWSIQPFGEGSARSQPSIHSLTCIDIRSIRMNEALE